MNKITRKHIPVIDSTNADVNIVGSSRTRPHVARKGTSVTNKDMVMKYRVKRVANYMEDCREIYESFCKSRTEGDNKLSLMFYNLLGIILHSTMHFLDISKEALQEDDSSANLEVLKSLLGDELFMMDDKTPLAESFITQYQGRRSSRGILTDPDRFNETQPIPYQTAPIPPLLESRQQNTTSSGFEPFDGLQSSPISRPSENRSQQLQQAYAPPLASEPRRTLETIMGNRFFLADTHLPLTEMGEEVTLSSSNNAPTHLPSPPLNPRPPRSADGARNVSFSLSPNSGNLNYDMKPILEDNNLSLIAGRPSTAGEDLAKIRNRYTQETRTGSAPNNIVRKSALRRGCIGNKSPRGSNYSFQRTQKRQTMMQENLSLHGELLRVVPLNAVGKQTEIKSTLDLKEERLDGLSYSSLDEWCTNKSQLNPSERLYSTTRVGNLDCKCQDEYKEVKEYDAHTRVPYDFDDVLDVEAHVNIHAMTNQSVTGSVLNL
jgi:hypothetical protein